MIRRIALLALLLAAPAAAQEADDTETFAIGADAFRAGATVRISEPGIDDVFAAGERVAIEAPISGSATLAARRVEAGAEIGGDLTAFGADVTVTAPVAGDATLMGYDVNVEAAIGADLRASGANVRLTAPVTGTAMLAGRSVFFSGAVEGDAVVAAEGLEFGPDARVAGRLTLYGEDADAIDVPGSVAPEDRIDRRLTDHWDAHTADGAESWPAVGWPGLVVGYIVGAVVLAVFVTLLAILAPASVERLRDIVRERPWRTFGMGFLALSVLLGAAFLLVLTVVGILAAPLVLIAAVLLGILGYLIGVYVVGRAVWGRFDGFPPDSIGEYALTALVGALVVSLVTLVPIAGWLVPPILALTGLGALTVAALRPEFRADA